MNKRLLVAGSFVILGLVLGGVDAFAAKGQRTTVLVQAEQEWQTSGVAIQAGDWICIAATGLWSHGYQPPVFPFYGPEGYEKVDPITIGPTFRVGLLIGRFSGSYDPRPFPIGEELCFVAGVSGELQLAMNDALGVFIDNAGTMKVTIQVGGKR